MEKRIQVGDRLKASKVTSDYEGCTLKISSPGKDFQVEMVFDSADKTRGSTLKFWSLECSVVRVVDSWDVEVLKVPVEITSDIPAEPKSRGAVVNIEGDGDFLAVRFTEDSWFPFILAGDSAEWMETYTLSWSDIVLIAEGRRIIVQNDEESLDYTDSYDRLVDITAEALYPWLKVVYSTPENTSRKVAEDIVNQVLAELT